MKVRQDNMCVIMVKKKGVELPKKEHLRNCFENNDDGAGLMYVDNNEVVIEKGFMTWESFEKRYEELCHIYNNFKNKALVCHFRIGTQGKNDGHTCHPFPVSSKHKMLRKIYLRTDVGMVHNGIIHEFGDTSKWAKLHPTDALLSDTQLFIRYCVNSFKSLNRQFYKNKQVMDYLDRVCGGRLCFLDKEENIYMLGDYVEENGVMYSNTTYNYVYHYYNYGRNNWNTNAYKEEEDTNITNLVDRDDYYYMLDGYNITDVEDYLISLNIGDIVYLASREQMFEIDENGVYYLDEPENNIYRVDKEGELIFLDIGWLTRY